MKKLLTALAVVAGLGFVMSCSDEVSDYTIGVPENGTRHEVTGTLTGTYTFVENEFFSLDGGEAAPVDTALYNKTISIGGKTYYYTTTTRTATFTSKNAQLSWTEGKNDYRDDYYMVSDKDSVSYSISFDKVTYDTFSYKEGNLDNNKVTLDRNVFNNKIYWSWKEAVAGEDVVVPTGEYTLKKVGDVYLRGDESLKVEGDVEGGEFTVASILCSEIPSADHVYVFDATDGITHEYAVPLKDTQTLTNLKFTPYEK